MLIAGGPGLGKTRTIEAVLARTQALGLEAWSVRCTAVAGAPAFWPFIQLFREALGARGAQALRALLGSEGADVASAISELREHLPGLPEPAPLSSESARFRLFDSVAVFLGRAADARPIALALDDLHQADHASLRLLTFLLRQVRRARILIVGAFRPEPGDSPETARLLHELTHEASARCATLSGLSRREIARYVELVEARHLLIVAVNVALTVGAAVMVAALGNGNNLVKVFDAVRRSRVDELREQASADAVGHAEEFDRALGNVALLEVQHASAIQRHRRRLRARLRA